MCLWIWMIVVATCQSINLKCKVCFLFYINIIHFLDTHTNITDAQYKISSLYNVFSKLENRSPVSFVLNWWKTKRWRAKSSPACCQHPLPAQLHSPSANISIWQAQTGSHTMTHTWSSYFHFCCVGMWHDLPFVDVMSLLHVFNG